MSELDDLNVVRQALRILSQPGEHWIVPESTLGADALTALDRVASRLAKLEAVAKAARPFRGQPGVDISDEFLTSWLDLGDALKALDGGTEVVATT